MYCTSVGSTLRLLAARSRGQEPVRGSGGNVNTFDFRRAARRRASQVAISHSLTDHRPASATPRGRSGDGARRSVSRSPTDLRRTGYLRTFPCSFRRVSLPSPQSACVRRNVHDYGFRYLITSDYLFGAGSVCSSFPPSKVHQLSAPRVSRPRPVEIVWLEWRECVPAHLATVVPHGGH